MLLRIGTDCSGIEAPIEALKQLNVPFVHKWSCEVDKYARQSILSNYKPEILFEDITQRDHSTLPDVDVYVCGFPCQPFSSVGLKKGLSDPRSNIMLHCIDVIKTKVPLIFVLENVTGFKTTQKGEPYNFLLSALQSIKMEGRQAYNIYVDTLNTKDYGIPQNRSRIYIVGILGNAQQKPYTTPPRIPCRSFDDFIFDKTVHKRFELPYVEKTLLTHKNIKLDELDGNWVISRTKFCTLMKDMSPTLITNPAHYLVKYNRFMMPTEALLLQGFSKSFVHAVSKTQLVKQIGNSMSVNVLKALFTGLLDIVKFD